MDNTEESSHSIEDFNTSSSPTDHPDGIDQQAYLKDQNCVICHIKFGKTSLSHTRKYFCKFCFRGVCGNCSSHRINGNRCCNSCYDAELQNKDKAKLIEENLIIRLKHLEESLQKLSENQIENERTLKNLEFISKQKESEIIELKFILENSKGHRNSREEDKINKTKYYDTLKNFEESQSQLVILANEKEKLRSSIHKAENEIILQNEKTFEIVKEIRELKEEIAASSQNKQTLRENIDLNAKLKDMEFQKDQDKVSIAESLELLRDQIISEQQENDSLRVSISGATSEAEFKKLIKKEQTKIFELKEEIKSLKNQIASQEIKRDSKFEELSVVERNTQPCKCEIF
ncbi:unnamed protein product [Blepharisma stoltei]|uniref:FYVE-type domain-containing protein n=1 Tax=Blepharisma stoltei TaxID=1481888 RepID=A0AAU9JJ33_9CILI|nr:unnamed protein product [Blepharisma stoltei]